MAQQIVNPVGSAPCPGLGEVSEHQRDHVLEPGVALANGEKVAPEHRREGVAVGQEEIAQRSDRDVELESIDA